MKEKTFTPQEHIRRTQIAAMALGLIDAIENGVIDTDTAHKMLFCPGIYENYKDDPDLYRLLNLGEELDSVIYWFPDDVVEKSVNDIRELCNKILSEGKKMYSMEDFRFILRRLEAKGYTVAPGLTDEDFDKLEKIYGITFPRELADFYSCGVPTGELFPSWNDFSEENVRSIKEKIEFPINALKGDVEHWFWLDKWGNEPETKEEALARFAEIAEKSPKMIPIYGHRYMPAFDGAPVISTVGRDTIYYGSDLAEYLKHEFLNIKWSPGKRKIKRIPLWSDVIEGE